MGMELNALTDRGTSDAITRRFGLPSSSNITLAPELMPVASIGELPELLYHAGWRRWQRSVFVAAVSAQVGRVQFRVKDPPSNVLVVMERIVCACGATTDIAADWGYGPAAVDLTTVVSAFEPRDGRQTPSASDSVVISSDTNAVALTATAVQLPMLANTPLILPGEPWVELPGFNMLLTTTTANAGFYVNYVWRTRRLQEQENVP
jgi:hypothetical protein